MLLSCDAKANGIGTKRNASAEPPTNTNQGISAQGSSFNADTHSLSNLQATKRKSSHAISSRDNDFIYDPQIRPHRQGNKKPTNVI